MWEWSYGNEAVDYKLLWLKIKKRLWMLPAITLLCGLIVLGLHIGYRVCSNGGRLYQATSLFYLDFAENSAGEEYSYFNYYTWGEMIHSDFFINQLQEATNHKYDKEQLKKYVTASVEADVRFVYVRCTTNDKLQSLELARAVEESFPIFAKQQKELAEITLAESASAAIDSTNIRGWNGFALGAVLGFLGAALGLLLYEAGNTAVALPITLERRYGYPVFGAPFMKEYKANCAHFVGKASGKLGIVYVDKVKEAAVLPGLECCTAMQNPFCSEQPLETLKEYQGIILAASAGKRNDKQIERLLDQLKRFQIPVIGMVLVNADEALVQKYYG